MSDAPRPTAQDRPRIAVAVCTYQRNEPLEHLLHALRDNAARLGERARVGVVVVDDSSDGAAEPVVAGFRDAFELGVTYRRSGRQNISIARNLAIETASERADWVAMTDDDCEPVDEWLESFLEMQQRTGADAICGRYRRRVPDTAPAWLSEQPFLEIAVDDRADGAPTDVAGTNNSMLSAAWWSAHPDVRFDPNLGVTGGEDMVFYRSAHAAGLKIVYAERATVYENEPPSRTTFAYQLRLFYWLGNSSYLTRRRIRAGAPARMFLQGARQVLRGSVRPMAQAMGGRPPQFRYALALIAYGIGLMAGPFGVRVRHH